MKTVFFIAAVFTFLVFASISYSQDPYTNPEAKVAELMKTSKTWSGQDIVYPEGDPGFTVTPFQALAIS